MTGRRQSTIVPVSTASKEEAMNRYVRLLALVAGCALAWLGTPASAQDKPIELKLSHWGPPTHVNQKVFLPWAEMVAQKSGGKLKVTVFPGGVLGKPADHWDMAQNGVVDIGWGTHNYTAGRFLLTSAMDLPFLANTAKGGSRALQEYYMKHLQKEHEKVKVLWLQCPAPFHLHMTKKAALTPADLTGVRIRTGGGQLSEIVKSLGAVPVALSVPETYNALERGVVDGTILPYEAAKAFKLIEVTKHVVEVRIFTASQFTVMNLAKYNALPPELRKVIDELSGVWGAEFAGAAWDKVEEEGLAAIRAAGLQHHKLSDAQRAQWREKTKVVEDEWVRSMETKGLPGKQALADLKDLLKRYDPAPTQ
jgi:TRAP-type C4-dicarboxylate transport system substrate-binding protein